MRAHDQLSEYSRSMAHSAMGIAASGSSELPVMPEALDVSDQNVS
jgi:hypothetical protein